MVETDSGFSSSSVNRNVHQWSQSRTGVRSGQTQYIKTSLLKYIYASLLKMGVWKEGEQCKVLGHPALT